MTELVLTTLEDGVLTLRLNRPEKKNALTDAMYAALADGLERADADPAVGAVLIASTSDAFTAGNDLADFAAVGAGTVRQGDRQVGRFLRTLATAQAPVVAAVPGIAVGVGTTMLLHCDLVFVSETVRLTAPFVGLGLVPEAGSSQLLVQRIGHARAFAMFVLGQALGAAEAVATGVANRALPAAELDAASREAARALAKAPREALREAKRLMRRPAEPLAARMDVENTAFAARLQSDEAKAIFAAFLARGAAKAG